MGNILTLLLRLLTFLIFIGAFTYVPFAIWRLKFWKNVDNGILRVILKILFILVVLYLEFTVLSFIVASIWTYEQSSGNCFGFSCPLAF